MPIQSAMIAKPGNMPYFMVSNAIKSAVNTMEIMP